MRRLIALLLLTLLSCVQEDPTTTPPTNGQTTTGPDGAPELDRQDTPVLIRSEDRITLEDGSIAVQVEYDNGATMILPVEQAEVGPPFRFEDIGGEAVLQGLSEAGVALALPSNAVILVASRASGESELDFRDALLYRLPATALPASFEPEAAIPANAIPFELAATAIPSNAIPSNALPSSLIEEEAAPVWAAELAPEAALPASWYLQPEPAVDPTDDTPVLLPLLVLREKEDRVISLVCEAERDEEDYELTCPVSGAITAPTAYLLVVLVPFKDFRGMTLGAVPVAAMHQAAALDAPNHPPRLEVPEELEVWAGRTSYLRLAALDEDGDLVELVAIEGLPEDFTVRKRKHLFIKPRLDEPAAEYPVQVTLRDLAVPPAETVAEFTLVLKSPVSWARVTGTNFPTEVFQRDNLAVRPDGGVLMVGQFSGVQDLGSGFPKAIPAPPPVQGDPSGDTVVLSVTDGGDLEWYHVFPGQYGQLQGVAAAGASSAVIFGGMMGRVDLGRFFGQVEVNLQGNPLEFTAPDSAFDGFMVELEAGHATTGRSLTGTSFDRVENLIGLTDGSRIVAANAVKSTAWSDQPFPKPLTLNSRLDVLVSRFDQHGGVVWTSTFGGEGAERLNAMAATTEGEVYLTGYFDGTVVLEPSPGGGLDTGYPTTPDGLDLFLVKLDAKGSLRWSRTYSGASKEIGVDLLALPDGSVVLLGSWQQELVLVGEEPAVSESTTSLVDNAVIARFDRDGGLLWSKVIACKKMVTPRSLSTLDDGRIAILGTFTGTCDFGAGFGTQEILVGAGQNDVFLLELDEQGTYLGTTAFGGTGSDVAHGFAGFDGGAYLTVVLAGETPLSSRFPGQSAPATGRYQTLLRIER